MAIRHVECPYCLHQATIVVPASEWRCGNCAIISVIDGCLIEKRNMPSGGTIPVRRPIPYEGSKA